MPKAVSGERADGVLPPKSSPPEDGVSDCCRHAWLAALMLAENVLLDEVYDRVQLRSPDEAVRQCVFAIRGLKEMGRAAWACEDG